MVIPVNSVERISTSMSVLGVAFFGLDMWTNSDNMEDIPHFDIFGPFAVSSNKNIKAEDLVPLLYGNQQGYARLRSALMRSYEVHMLSAGNCNDKEAKETRTKICDEAF